MQLVARIEVAARLGDVEDAVKAFDKTIQKTARAVVHRKLGPKLQPGYKPISEAAHKARPLAVEKVARHLPPHIGLREGQVHTHAAGRHGGDRGPRVA